MLTPHFNKSYPVRDYTFKLPPFFKAPWRRIPDRYAYNIWKEVAHYPEVFDVLESEMKLEFRISREVYGRSIPLHALGEGHELIDLEIDLLGHPLAVPIYKTPEGLQFCGKTFFRDRFSWEFTEPILERLYANPDYLDVFMRLAVMSQVWESGRSVIIESQEDLETWIDPSTVELHWKDCLPHEIYEFETRFVETRRCVSFFGSVLRNGILARDADYIDRSGWNSHKYLDPHVAELQEENSYVIYIGFAPFRPKISMGLIRYFIDPKLL